MFQTNIGQLVLYISSPVMKMDPKEAKASNFGCSQASDRQCVWNRECEVFSNHSLQLELTVEVFFFTISDINTEVSEVILASFWSPEACDCTCCYHDTCLFPEHSDSCWKCCLIFLIERHEHFYSIVALTKAHTFFIYYYYYYANIYTLFTHDGRIFNPLVVLQSF